MRLFKRANILIVVCLIIMFIPATGLAAGKVIIKPKVTVSGRTDDNFYKAETNQREVNTYIFKPGIELGYETPKSLLSLDFTLNDYNYDDEDPVPAGATPADRQDYTGQTGILNMRSQVTDRLALGLSDSYTKTRDPAASDRFSNSTARDKYYINTLTPQLNYNFGEKFGIGLKYQHTETDYNLVTREDSTEKRPIGDLIYNFNRTTSMDLEYQHWTRDYDLTTSDYTSDQLKLILRKQYKYFALEAGGGSQERDFDDPTLADIDVTIYRVGIVGQNPPAPDAEPRSRIALGIERNLNDAGTGDAYFTADRYLLDAKYVYMEKIPLSLRVSYQESDYERTYGLTPAGVNVLRDEDTLTIEGSIGYIITDWLLFSITAGDEERNSNHAGRNYDNTYFGAKLEFSYDIGKR